MKCQWNYIPVILSIILFFVALYFHSSNKPFVLEQSPPIDQHNLFTERVDRCTSQSSLPNLFDQTRHKNKYLLCKLNMTQYCIRTSPVEEQEYFYVIAPIYSVNQNVNILLYDLHRNFKTFCESLGVKFVQVEYIFPHQNFILTQPNNEPLDIQIIGQNIFYLRENLVNVAEKKLPEDYEYISWIDAHLHFDNPYTFQETIVQLGRHNIVSSLSAIRFKDKENRTTQVTEYPFAYQAYYHNSTPKSEEGYHLFPYYGLMFATTKNIFRAMNGLPDLCISGACDVYMSHALTNGPINVDLPSLKNAIEDWKINAVQKINGDFGYVRNVLTHYDHYFLLRRYSNWDDAFHKLKERNFDPKTDLKRDINGTLYFVKNFELAYDYWKYYASI